MSLGFPFPIPSGWFPISASPDLAAGEIRSLECFGRPLVVFRGASASPGTEREPEASVIDAHCPHLGAHLGVGGKVIGGNIRCPFHGWEFNGAGACIRVPYAKRVPPGATLRSYPTCERNGFVWAWYDPEDRPPFYEIPDLPRIGSADWMETFRKTWRIRSPIQEMGENGVDSAHFPTVHGSASVPPSEVTSEGATRRAVQYTEVETAKGRARNTIEVNSAGLGFGYTHFTGLFETISLNCMAPIDEQTSELTVVFYQPKVGSGAGIAKAICLDLDKQIGEDIPIWENKRYQSSPVLCDGDGPIAEYRRWCRQFYPDYVESGRVESGRVEPGAVEPGAGSDNGPGSH